MYHSSSHWPHTALAVIASTLAITDVHSLLGPALIAAGNVLAAVLTAIINRRAQKLLEAESFRRRQAERIACQNRQ